MTIIKMQELIDEAGAERAAGRRNIPAEAKLTGSLQKIMIAGCNRIIVSGGAFRAIVGQAPRWIRFEPVRRVAA